MKKSILATAVILSAFSMASFAETYSDALNTEKKGANVVGKDIYKAGEDTVKGLETAGRDTDKGLETAGRDTGADKAARNFDNSKTAKSIDKDTKKVSKDTKKFSKDTTDFFEGKDKAKIRY